MKNKKFSTNAWDSNSVRAKDGSESYRGETVDRCFVRGKEKLNYGGGESTEANT